MRFSDSGVVLDLPQGTLLLRVNTALQWLHVCNISAGLNRLERGMASGRGTETVTSMGPRFLDELERAFVKPDFDLLYGFLYESQSNSQSNVSKEVQHERSPIV